jgi:hypothetical protein
MALALALTRDFKLTILARMRRDPKFCDALLRECIEASQASDGCPCDPGAPREGSGDRRVHVAGRSAGKVRLRP